MSDLLTVPAPSPARAAPARPPASVHLHGLATAVPPTVLPQTLVTDIARRILGPRYRSFEKLASAFENAGIDRRYSVADVAWFETPKTWSERNALYLTGATALFAAAARAALADAGLSARDIDAVVTVTSTGIATPTLEALAFGELGFRSDVQRAPVFGLGCAGGVSGLALARDLAVARPGTRVLMVAVETCTLSFRADRLLKADVIATALFGDGAAAAIVSTEAAAPASDVAPVAFGAGHQHLWPDTLGIMGWDVDDTGLGVVFDRTIPAFALSHLRPAAEGALRRDGRALGDIDRFVCHPGGAKVVVAIEDALELAPGSLTAERETLRDYGNMSAPTALFVLDRVRRGDERGEMMLMALGPGFTASFLPMRAG